MSKKILGIVGSYRKNGVVDTLVTEALGAAERCGAITRKIYLVDARIGFCTNCRSCTQKPGVEPGECVLSDEMQAILDEWKSCDALIIGAPVNFFNVTAVMRRFMERLICFSCWPWGRPAPTMRNKVRVKKAVLITATAMPALLGRIFTGAVRALKLTAKTLGAKPVKTIFVGLVASQPEVALSRGAIRKAQAAGRALAS